MYFKKELMVLLMILVMMLKRKAKLVQFFWLLLSFKTQLSLFWDLIECLKLDDWLEDNA
jgi:hypothetical protein